MTYINADIGIKKILYLVTVFLISCNTKTSKVLQYDENGKLELEYYEKDGKYVDTLKAYYSDGKVWAKVFYVEGKRDGVHYIYYPNGVIQQKTFYINGVLSGEYEIYNINGSPKERGNFINNKQQGHAYYYRVDSSLEEYKCYGDDIMFSRKYNEKMKTVLDSGRVISVNQIIKEDKHIKILIPYAQPPNTKVTLTADAYYHQESRSMDLKMGDLYGQLLIKPTDSMTKVIVHAVMRDSTTGEILLKNGMGIDLNYTHK